MTLPDDTIAKWSRRGDPIHAWYSYEMVRESLTAARLDSLSYAIYPQGSYANKTNIAGDSDVDMVIALRSAFYPDKSELSQKEIKEYERYYEESDWTWHRFREVVVRALKSNYLVQERSKCVKVRSNLVRLPADVLIALDYRYYKSFLTLFDQTFIEGVQFYSSKGAQIINYPKRHVRSCARKNNDTGGRYRSVVRIAKNARNELAGDGETQVGAGTAPSYFLESLLWNVPDSCYSGSLQQSYRQVMDWLHENQGQLASMDFPNEMGKLFGDAPDAVWNESDARTIIDAMHHQLS
jgi:hypothetical protein